MALSFRAGHDAEVLRPEEARPTTTPTGDGTVPEEGIVTAPAGRSRVLRAADDTGAAGPADNAGAPADNTAPQEAPSELMGDLPVPKALQQTGNWALLNLIFAILTVMIASELLRRYFERIDTEEDEYIVRREGRLRLGGILPAAGAILMEAATQDFTKPMVLFDDRVWLMAALLFAELAVAAAVYVRYDRGGGKGGWLEKDPA
jgi:hypothetical protein